VLVKGEAAAQGAEPVGGELTVSFKGVNEVLGVSFGEVLSAKIVNTQNKRWCVLCDGAMGRG
jgi:hypothetical protein